VGADLAGAPGDALWFYLGKLLWPHPLITIYPRWRIDATQWVSYLPLLAVIVILSIFWLKRELWSRAWFFAFAYFMAALLPALGLIDNYIFRFSLVFDHFQYLASIGPLALVGTGLARYSDLIIPKKPLLQLTLCAGLLLILGMASWQRTWNYASEETLWTDTLAKNPNSWLGHNNLGLAFLRKEQRDEAFMHFQKSLEINPNYVEARSNLGLTLFQKGQLDEAVAQYQKALEIDPNSLVTHANLGNALFKKRQLREAIAQYQKASELDPNSFAIRYNLGVALFQYGQLDEAIAQFQEALRLKPDFSPAKVYLAHAREGSLTP
jgi:tetratricopeptide (TPR) repeat protein